MNMTMLSKALIYLGVALASLPASAADNSWLDPTTASRPENFVREGASQIREAQLKYSQKSMPAKQALSRGQQIEGFIFGAGLLQDEPKRMVKMGAALSLQLKRFHMQVPEIGIRDLASLSLSSPTKRIFRSGDRIVLQIDGPEGSEGYDVQFVSDGKRFQYRLVKFLVGPFLMRFPNPLRLDFPTAATGVKTPRG